MGCAASGPKDGGAFAAPSETPKYRFGKADATVLGAGVPADKVTVRAIFEAGKSTIFLLSAPGTLEQVKSFPTDTPAAAAASTQEGEGATGNNINEDAAGEGAAQDAQGAQDAQTAQAAPAAAAEKPRVRWAIYNDGKAEVKLTCTFFHAEDIQTLDATATKEDRMEGGRLQAEVTVPPLKTVPYVEGPVGGYMWKCMVKNVEGGYDLARTYEERS